MWWGGNGDRHWDRNTWRTFCEDIWRRSNEDKRKEEKRKEEIVGVRLIWRFVDVQCARDELGFACLELKEPWSTEKTEVVLPAAKMN